MEPVRAGTRPDRRATTRLPNPLCRHCQSTEHVHGLIRAHFVIYFRCRACGDLWTRQVPLIVGPETTSH
jgi:hypothetical protein